MNRWLAGRVLLPLHERLRGRRTFAFVRRFARDEAGDAASLAATSRERLVTLVRHAARTTPFWRERFREIGMRPEDFRGPEDLARIPPVGKPEIRAAGEAMIADGHRGRVFALETGGSSGEPLRFFTDRDRESSQLALKARFRARFGVRPGDRQVDLWGSPIELAANDRLRIAKDRLLNYRLLSAFDLSDAAMAGFADVLRRDGADFVYGYASVLARWARFLEERGEDLHDLGLKAAFTTAEVLFDDQRALVARVFGCPVANEYGCRDGGLIAHECPAGGFHRAAHAITVEILDDEQRAVPPGEEGEVVVTNHFSFGFPILRYRLGDRASLPTGACSCGSPLPLLGPVRGRVTDLLTAPDGRRVHALALIYVLRALPAVLRFQIVQEEIDRIVVRVVPAPGAAREALVASVEGGVRKAMGDRMRVAVALVDAIPPLPSGKTRVVVNRVGDAAS